MAAIPPADNLDIDPVSGHEPYRRLRIGDWRVLYRQLTPREIDLLVMRRGTLESSTGFLIARIVNRKDLERAVATIDLVEL